MFFLAFSMPLRIASGTSWALPRPAPTDPFPSPTTTMALNRKRRPPFTTLAVLFIAITLSRSSNSSIFLLSNDLSLPYRLSNCRLKTSVLLLSRRRPETLPCRDRGTFRDRRRPHQYRWPGVALPATPPPDRKSTRLNTSHGYI